MPKLLHIQSSPNIGNSVTRDLSDQFVRKWTENHCNVDVELLDLAVEPLPHFGPEILQAAGTAPEEMSEATRAAIALSDRLIEQLEGANVLVIGSPMINFSICTQLKSWFDHVTIAGKTFEYAAPGVARGLLFAKRAFVIEARGGDYADLPFSAFDFQEPLLKALLMFLGIFDVTFIRAEGMRMNEEEAEDIVRNAQGIVSRVAA
ncbi:MAG: NAD(P)H-dependent oxidoreductase [Gammaproteobacteria bacterium]|nr:NAD(P)H-dependent oxidoreductase [Rhodospirillaceae bacterium]MDE0365095.1 NAD(P)H-dependent oxidoreductase [Gammaproteobacteria bacterium]